MRVFFYISGHGFGHASRDIELINAIARRHPDTEFVVRTSVPPWLFSTARASIDVQPAVTDTGLTQLDSLRFDEHESAEQARRFYASFDQRIDEECDVLRSHGASLVIGDIPPLAFAAAARAGLPSIAVGNFTWDWIYGPFRGFDDVLPIIRDAYASAGRTFRLPFHGGFESMAAVTDVPLIARRSFRDPADTRRLLGVADDRRLVLASFGGYGLDIPLERLTMSTSFTLVTYERHPPHGLAHHDVVAAADVVVSKPGYGIVSECIANETAFLFTSRGRFVEYDVMVAEMPRVLRCQFLNRETLLSGRWDEAVDTVLAQPKPPETWPIDGAEVIAGEIIP